MFYLDRLGCLTPFLPFKRLNRLITVYGLNYTISHCLPFKCHLNSRLARLGKRSPVISNNKRKKENKNKIIATWSGPRTWPKPNA
jgi:hypothetical protein